MRICLFLLAYLLTGSLAHAACQGKAITEGVHNPPFCIPAEARRIVTLDPLITLGLLIEMKAPVVATPYMAITENEVLDVVKAEKMIDLGNPREPSLERVAALKPDLIIGSAEASIFWNSRKIRDHLVHAAFLKKMRNIGILRSLVVQTDTVLVTASGSLVSQRNGMTDSW